MTRDQNGRPVVYGERLLNRRTIIKYGVASGAAAVFLGACGGGDSDADTSAATTVSSAEPETKPDKITVRCWGDPYRAFWRDTAGKQFTDDTGIAVEWDTSDIGPLVTRIRAAVDADQQPPVAAVMGEGVYSFLAYAQGLAVDLDPEIAPNLLELNPALAQVGFDTPEWAMLTIWGFSAPINYLADKVDGSLFESWEGMWDPSLKGRILLPNTYTAFTFSTAALLGIEPAADNMGPVFEKIAELKPNILGTGGDTEVVSSFISGDAWASVALPGTGSAAADEGAKVEFAVPKEGMMIDRDFYWVTKGNPPEVEYYAKLFANYVCDVKNQGAMAEELGVIPTHPDTKLPKYMTDNPTVYPVTEEEVSKNFLVPLPLAAENQDAWQAEYDRAVKS